MASISIKVEFSGGLELLFSNERLHRLTIASIVPIDNHTPKSEEIIEGETKLVDVTFLIHYLRDNLLKERVELFMENNTVRPGILVLINDTDWELEGEGEYVLKDGDDIVFISTLHGG
ncbi:ubiquitin-related modifier 1 [Crucibulum laeve]|uniref:Ubiquitin-related modifier 1 n=1 Tax=Crucibulum laeve TaxID=68775 RepID=A0A5C3LFF5_9AGAR|nr:ubiquitin-related modifier 1 [Crucibulum laeve]